MNNFFVKVLFALIMSFIIAGMLSKCYQLTLKHRDDVSYVNASYYCVENFVYVKIDEGLAPMFNDMGRPLSCKEWKENKRK